MSSKGAIEKIRRRVAFTPGSRAVALILCLLFALGSLAGCSAVANGIFDNILSERPDAADTETDLAAVAEKLSDALEKGERTLTLNLVAENSDIKKITENMSYFWGWPDTFVVLKEYSNVKLTEDEDAKPVDVKKVKFNLVQSNNYYAYNAWMDSEFSIPEDKTEAIAVYDSLKTVIPEVFGDKLNADRIVEMSAYDSALAVHDWLVANLTYDDTVEQTGTANGSYGALVDRKTMCQGYSETLQLILFCTTDTQVEMMTGKGNSGDGNWIGHAWNRIYLDDAWYQVDATFDDPMGNPAGAVNHYYFGQSDEVMSYDHNWDNESWEPTTGSDFLWYRKNNLYAEKKSTFKAIVTKLMKNKKPKRMEIVVRGFSPTESDLQFIFDLDSNIKSVYHSATEVGSAEVIGLEFKY